MRERNMPKMAGLALCCALFFPCPAYCYIDPGTGSYLFQIAVAALVAVAFAVKVYWLKVRKFIAGLFAGKKDGCR